MVLVTASEVRVPQSFLPNSLQMHWSNLDDVSGLFTLQNTISASACHTGNVEQLGAIDHVIIYEQSE
jgi:hypothetical protein